MPTIDVDRQSIVNSDCANSSFIDYYQGRYSLLTVRFGPGSRHVDMGSRRRNRLDRGGVGSVNCGWTNNILRKQTSSMSTFTVPALLAFITANQCVPASMATVMVGVALHENPKLDTDARHLNANGTWDLGLAQVNETNLRWTGLKDPLNPCQNLHAAMMVLFAKYNGNPPDAGKAVYATGLLAAIPKDGVESRSTSSADGMPPAVYAHPAHGRDLAFLH